MNHDTDVLIDFFLTFYIFKNKQKNNRLNKIYSRHMQSLCTLLLLIRSAQLSTKNANTTGRQGGAGDVGQWWERGKEPRSEVEGSKEETNVGKRRGG